MIFSAYQGEKIMEDVLSNLGIVGIVIGAILIGGGFLTKFKNNAALDQNDEGNKEVAEKEKEVAVIDAKLKDEQQKRELIKEQYKKETGREITDEELNDFFNDRYGSK